MITKNLRPMAFKSENYKPDYDARKRDLMGRVPNHEEDLSARVFVTKVKAEKCMDFLNDTLNKKPLEDIVS